MSDYFCYPVPLFDCGIHYFREYRRRLCCDIFQDFSQNWCEMMTIDKKFNVSFTRNFPKLVDQGEVLSSITIFVQPISGGNMI